MEEEKKAYDLKLLIEIAKTKGLDVAEDGAEVLYHTLMEWLVESAMLSATPIDDILIIAKSTIDGLVLPQIDKINGKIEE